MGRDDNIAVDFQECSFEVETWCSLLNAMIELYQAARLIGWEESLGIDVLTHTGNYTDQRRLP